MSVDNKAPEIRIKNFSGIWYELALSNVIDVRSGKDYKHLGKGNIPVYGTGGYMLSVDSALSNDEDAIGIGRKGTIDKPCILRAPFWTVDTLFYAVPFPGFNLDFLFCLFQRIEWKKHDESTGVPSLSKIAINNVPVYTTNKLEQTAIGNYFQKLDALINQHQQKHDKLSSIKKAMLEKMFPKPGETMPEIRFKGFSGEWAEIKFSEIFNEKDGIRRGPFGGSIKKEMFVAKSDYVVYEQRNAIYDRYDTRYNISKEKYQELINFSLTSGDFIMSGAGTIGRVSRVPDGVKIGVFNQAIIRMKINDERIDSEFFLQWIRSEKMQKRLTESNPASAMVNLVPMNELKAWDVVVPNKKEQSTIGNYFQKLDALINQHQQQITKLNNIKQACLSKMFV
ncbi:restriction endonuclease subunit S [Yersinia alsatica]|uniref:restriction endonuclease subunit S n=1 Tax=Yersinia alsatica TaxID=2890317 RepID=UPI00119F45AE|nr:restriction endonuclease subunit S [Yersinia alsatica]